MRRRRLGVAPFLGLVAIYLLAAVLAPPSFSTWANIQTIIRQTTIVGILSVGMTVVIISGGIDLSVGSIIALTTVAVAYFLQSGSSPLLAAGAGLGVGALCGLFNGVLIAFFKVGPFIVTLGSLLLVRGMAKGIANEQKIDAPLSWLNELMSVLSPDHHWLLVPYGVWILLVSAVAIFVLLRFTRFGLYTFATGSNENNARLCGVPIEGMKVATYALSSTFAGLAGLMQFSRLTVGDPTVASGIELDAIAAVVIGGGSLSGGEGSVLGSLVGALIMTTIRSAASHMGLSNWIQEILTGVIIISAVGMDRLRHR
ncbi:MAG: ABC transporter permease [Bdellovibrio sp.]|nr:MAG: ABC transporter permease [Bdellovibrio sp.]